MKEWGRRLVVGIWEGDVFFRRKDMSRILGVLEFILVWELRDNRRDLGWRGERGDGFYCFSGSVFSSLVSLFLLAVSCRSFFCI